LHNVVAAGVLIDAGADLNSMTLTEGFPLGLSPKDILFIRVFSLEGYYEADAQTKREGILAIEKLLRLFQQPEISRKAKRSKTLRAQLCKDSMTPRQRRVTRYVEILSLMSESLLTTSRC
jgi:hypothetical protein